MARNRILSDSEKLEAFLRQVAAAPAVEPSAELFPLSPGAVVADAYRIEARIGIGRMGVVYRAFDLSLGRCVALELHRGRPDPDRLHRLRRQASAMAKLSHPNVGTIFGVGHHRDAQGQARLFVATELVAGGSLVAWTRETLRAWPEIVALFVQAGAGLAAAHGVGVVHRDFKPDNVLVDERGRARVVDFGMAPEQWEGTEVTAKCDQYAFCVSLHEMLCGARVPAQLVEVLRRGMARDPARRFESMDALVAACSPSSWWRV